VKREELDVFGHLETIVYGRAGAVSCLGWLIRRLLVSEKNRKLYRVGSGQRVYREQSEGEKAQ
jgi:hypothetical protein